jgi:hypothetical protein
MKIVVALCVLSAWIVLSDVQQGPPPERGQSQQESAQKAQRNTAASTRETQKTPTAQPVDEPPDDNPARIRENDKQNIQIISATPKEPISFIKSILDIIGVLCTLALAVVGIVGICIALETLREMRSQRRTMLGQLRAMLKQRGEMQRQVDEMSKQTANLEKSVVIAAKSADVAHNSLEMFVSKERARLRIEMKPLRIMPKHDEVRTVDFVVSIHGPTPAFVVESACVTYVWDWNMMELPDVGDRVMFPIHPLPPVVPSNSPALECFSFVLLGAEEKSVLIDEVKAGRMFVGIRGFIKYRDVFDRDRKTSFRYAWKYSSMYGLGTEYGDW